MKDTIEFFADTYALIEIVGGNPRYHSYLQHTLLTTIFNLIELYYSFLKDYGKATADLYFREYSRNIIPISETAVAFGMAFKLEHKMENLSYADCIGYALALELGIKFLTGDQKFQDKPKVEFVK